MELIHMVGILSNHAPDTVPWQQYSITITIILIIILIIVTIIDDSKKGCAYL